MKTLNIWYLSAHDQPRGQSARTYDYAKELIKRGHQVTMFTNSYCHWTHRELLGPDEKWRIESIDGIRVVWLHTYPYAGNGLKRGLNMISNYWRCMQVSKVLTDKPDVVIGPSVPLGTAWAAMRIAKMKDAAFVFEVRDVWPIALVDDGGMSKLSPLYFVFRFMEKTLYKKAHKISATMPYIQNHVAESGSSPEKVKWLPNGVDMSRFPQNKPYDGGKTLPLTVMYVGGYGNAHDVITLVRAAIILKKQGRTEFKFILIGNGVKRTECEREAKQHNLDSLEFRDAIPKNDIPKTQELADVLVACVLDSPIYRFGLNLNKLFDYFASERPVVFSGKAKNDPILESGAGFSIPPESPEQMAETLLKILSLTPEQRIEMGKRGRAYVSSRFQMRTLAEGMESLLIEALERKESE